MATRSYNLFGAIVLCSIGAAITIIPMKQCLRKAPLLLIVEARVKWLSRICERFPIIAALDLIIGILAHLVDQIDAALLVGPRIAPFLPFDATPCSPRQAGARGSKNGGSRKRGVGWAAKGPPSPDGETDIERHQNKLVAEDYECRERKRRDLANSIWSSGSVPPGGQTDGVAGP
jgi:hypothetical protein